MRQVKGNQAQDPSMPGKSWASFLAWLPANSSFLAPRGSGRLQEPHASSLGITVKPKPCLICLEPTTQTFCLVLAFGALLASNLNHNLLTRPNWNAHFFIRLGVPELAFLKLGSPFCSVTQLCLTLWPHELQHARLPWINCLPEFAQTQVHWVYDATQPPHPLLSPSPPALNLSQHQGLFQWAGPLHQVAKVLDKLLAKVLGSPRGFIRHSDHLEVLSFMCRTRPLASPGSADDCLITRSCHMIPVTVLWWW